MAHSTTLAHIAPPQVYKVLFPYSSHKDDELELVEGDCIHVSASDQGRTGTHHLFPPLTPSPSPSSLPPDSLPPPTSLTDNEGWFFGTSHNTGTSGLYPGNYVEKTKESDCWVLHRWVGRAGM